MMKMWVTKQNRMMIVSLVLITWCVGQTAWADPCGMVPPIYPGNDVPIARVGLQKTYVFYKGGIETFVIRPGFTGKVDEFGMLIPFPNPPALRKVSDDVFAHIAAAIDPPEIVVDLTPRDNDPEATVMADSATEEAGSAGQSLSFHSVRVLKQEAVGMYEVAVLEAGSAQALNQWMTDHGFKYPTGMDDVCNDYVELGWCFVAVKTRVGQKKGVDPKPGQRQVNSTLPAGANFDGHVQAMGFRFHSDELVVPMRLSAFNEGELHNVVYLLTDEPMRAKSISAGHVVRQVSGEALYRNVTAPLPLRIIGGKYSDIPERRLNTIEQERDPAPYNGIARELFASDLLTVREGQLSHPHEETEKVLLRIGERLGLRGPEIDSLHQEAISAEREKVVTIALEDLKSMTLTVIDGDFPRDVISEENVTFTSYEMDEVKNTPASYDAKLFGRGPQQTGQREVAEVRYTDKAGGTVILESRPGWIQRNLLSVILAAAGLLLMAILYKLRVRPGGGAAASILLLGLAIATTATADDQRSKQGTIRDLLRQLGDGQKAEQAIDALVKIGEPAVPFLAGEAEEGTDLSRRGWAIVCLAEIGGKQANGTLAAIQRNSRHSQLVHTWAVAAQVQVADSTNKLIELAKLVPQYPAVVRPIAMRLVEPRPGDKPASAEQLLSLSINVWQLQQTLTPIILSMGRDPLNVTMTSANDQNARRQAAAYLATLATQGDKQVAAAVVETYRFNPQATTLPWDGGPLFIPMLQWGTESRLLVGQLIRWLLWCELNQKNDLRQPIINNLQSFQLMQAAGYQAASSPTTEAWLLTWGKLVGPRELKRILAEQGVADNPRFKNILMQLP